MTSPSVPVPETVVDCSYTGEVVMDTEFVDCWNTVTEFEGKLLDSHVLDEVATAVIKLPGAIFNPETNHVPFAETRVLDPTGFPSENTCIVVPSGSVEVPATSVMFDAVQ